MSDRRYTVGTYGVGVTWRPKPHPILRTLSGLLLAFVCIAGIIVAISTGT